MWELRQNVQNPSLIIALVGNKVDLAEEARQVPAAPAVPACRLCLDLGPLTGATPAVHAAACAHAGLSGGQRQPPHRSRHATSACFGLLLGRLPHEYPPPHPPTPHTHIHAFPPPPHAQVPEADARTYAAETGLLYFETSAKADINVTALFDEVADK